MADAGFKPPAKMSNRERDELLKRGIPIQPPIVPPQPQLQQTEIETQPQTPPQPQNITNTTRAATPEHEHYTSQPSTPQQNNEEEEVKPARSFLCEKCKWCDGFEPTTNEKQVCRVCKCDLIFHIDVIEEEDEDAEEFSSDDEVWGAREETSFGGDSD